MTRAAGWDIGGAHLKLAVVDESGAAAARQVPCRLWEGLDEFRRAVRTVLAEQAPMEWHAVTMTGELADLFPDRASGVRAILDLLAEFVPPAAVSVYATGGAFLPIEDAKERPHLVASANWDATARILARRLGEGLLVDIGSTTTDLVPFRDGAVAARGRDDAERLATGELVYTGAVRTPLAAIASEVPFDGRRLGVAAEFFATAADAHRLTSALPVGADLHASADGRGKSLAESRARLARMIGADADTASEEAWRLLAAAFARAQMRRIEAAAETVLSRALLPPDAPVVGAGTGRFLAAELARRIDRPYSAFDAVVGAGPDIGEAVSDVAPAVAVALLLGAR
jgi:(4-(4-[2-(gamma-L-glutamylamino)ethyl]phenoxymethyl)furan-2-yl)methanamine synthase